MLEWEGVSLGYHRTGRKIFEEFSLTVEDSTVLLGPTGSGKSTLLASIVGILPEVNGIIRIGQRPVGRGGAAGRQWASYVPGANLLPRELTVSEYLTEIGRLDGMSSASSRRHAQAVAERLQLTESLRVRMRAVSCATKRKTLIAAAVLKPAEWLLVDEPTSGLDPEGQRLVLTLLQAESRHRGVLVATRQVAETAVFPDRLLLLHDGQIIFDGPCPRLAEGAQGHVFRVPQKAVGEAPSDRWWQPMPGGEIKIYRQACPPSAIGIEPTVEDGYFWALLNVESKPDLERAATDSPEGPVEAMTSTNDPPYREKITHGQ